jgi:hypothetical protein
MRTAICVVVAMAAASGTARGDDRKDITALVTTDVQTGLDPDAKPPPRLDNYRYFNVITTHSSSSWRENLYGRFASKIVQDIRDVVIGFDESRHAAWFHATIESSYAWTPCDEAKKCEPTTTRRKTWRYSGIAIDEHGWKLAVTMWSHVIPDAELFKRAEPIKAPYISVAKTEPARVVQRWFDGGAIAKDISASASALAAGTAPGEVGQGKAAAQLARTWDGLKMSAPIIMSHEFGSVAFVQAWVHLADKKRKDYDVVMAFGAVLANENGNWRWAMLSFAAPADPFE